MNNATRDLLEQHFDTAFSAPNGIKKLRELILTLAMQGKLVPQDPNDPPASELLKEIEAEKKRLVKEGTIKAPKLLPVTGKEMPYALPQNWQWVRLGQVCYYNGRENVSPESIAPETWLLDLEDIEKNTSQLLYRAKYAERQSKSAKSTFQKGDVLYGKLRPYLDKVLVADTDGVCTTEIVPIVPLMVMDSRFLRWLLKRHAFLAHVNSLMYGVKMPRLGTQDAVESIHPLPPLPEQHRIVAKIDQLMARCDALENFQKARDKKRLATHAAALAQLLETTDNGSADAWAFISEHFCDLYAVKENVVQLRKAVLQLAVMGRLVLQDPTDPPASALLKEIEAEKKRLVKDGKIKAPKALPEIKPAEVPYALPQGWEWVRLGDIASKITDGDHKTPPRISAGSRLFSAKNVRDGYLDFDNCDFISQQHYLKSRERCCPDTGDLLIVSVGGTIGRTSLVPDDSDFALVRSVALIKPLLFSSAYLKHAMNSNLLQDSIHARKRGGAQPCLYLSEIEKFIFSLPPLREQHRIVAKIDQLMALCDTLDECIANATGKKTELLNAVMAHV